MDLRIGRVRCYMLDVPWAGFFVRGRVMLMTTGMLVRKDRRGPAAHDACHAVGWDGVVTAAITRLAAWGDAMSGVEERGGEPGAVLWFSFCVVGSLSPAAGGSCQLPARSGTWSGGHESVGRMSMSSPSAWATCWLIIWKARSCPARVRTVTGISIRSTMSRRRSGSSGCAKALGGRRREVEASYRLLARLQKLYTYLRTCFWSYEQERQYSESGFRCFWNQSY